MEVAMKVEFHIKDIVITASQKSLIEKKMMKLKRYSKNEPMTVDIYLRDETSPEKGGIDQAVELSATFGHEKLFVREIDNRLMRAFAFAYKSLERQMQRFHKKQIDKEHEGSEKAVSRLFRALKIKK
jgi:ribosomal subunit interface protein